MLSFLKDRQRKRLKARPFPNEWLRMIKTNVAFFTRLPANDQAESALAILSHLERLLA